jgi:hypothetical protein
MGRDTAGEQLAAAYLRRRFDRFAERHRPVGGKRLDWSVALLSLSDLRCTNRKSDFLRVVVPSRHTAAFVQEQQEEADPAAKNAGLPFVGVLARTKADIDFSPDLVAGAMFGDLTIVMPIGPNVESFDPSRATTSFGKGGRLQPGQIARCQRRRDHQSLQSHSLASGRGTEVRTASLPKWHAGMSAKQRNEIQTAIARAACEIEEQFVR